MSMESMKMGGRWSHSIREAALWLAITGVLLTGVARMISDGD